MKKITITDVAKLAGVSEKTVSRVANGEPNVRDATRHKVRVAIEQLQYQPDQHARQLALRRASHLAGQPTASRAAEA